MNNYGNMEKSLQRVAGYQDITCEWMPGHGEDCYRITVDEGVTTLSDVFHIHNDGDLNRAINSLYQRALNANN